MQTGTFGKKAAPHRTWKSTERTGVRTSGGRQAEPELSPEAIAFRQQEVSAADGILRESWHGSVIKGGRPAGLLRLLAFIIDTMLVTAPLIIIFWPQIWSDVDAVYAADPELAGTEAGEAALIIAMWNYILIHGLIRITYSVVMEASSWQATIGKKVLGLVVCDNDGNKPGLGGVIMRNTLGRFVANIIPFLVGYLMILFNEQKKGIHDYMAGTTVRMRA